MNKLPLGVLAPEYGQAETYPLNLIRIIPAKGKLIG